MERYLHVIAKGNFKNTFSQKVGDTFIATILIYFCFFSRSGNNSFSILVKKQDDFRQEYFTLKSVKDEPEKCHWVTKIFKFGYLLFDFYFHI